jgi:serine/threonine-protein kinase
MVMEFLRGLNLRTLLAQYGKLEPAQVVEVALPVLAALDHAHGHGIVHRDVKPENILIAQDGTVKVADFGLARAYAESYVSQAEGTVTGTVQYLAPEQIQGEPADPRTDLYAFGIVMFEMLTGRPPFAGETSLAIAYQHLSGRVPVPSSIEPSVPTTLDRVVVRATEKDRADRPASAKAMRDEIALAGVGLPPAPRIAELAGQIPGVELVPEDRATTVTIPRAISPRARRRRRFRLVAGLIALVALLAVGVWATWVYAIPHYTNVPSVQGLTTRQAVVRLEQAGLRPVTADGVFSTSVPSGHVIRVTPEDGARIRKGSSVTLVPSLGPELVPVTDVRGQTLAEARAALQQEGFEVRVVRRADDQIPKDQVIDQNPQAPVKLEKGATVTLTVSNGPPLVEVPDVTGQSAADATATLENFAFTVATQEDFSTEVPKGDVISTDPPAHAKAKKGSEVTIVVSKGPKTFAMPDVTGKTKEAAMAQLQGLGLIVHVFTLPNTQGDVVVFQDPDPGTIVKQGDTVTIYVTAT